MGELYPDMQPRPLSGVDIRNDFVLGKIDGRLWLGVKFGDTWKPARPARAQELNYFGQRLQSRLSSTIPIQGDKE